MDINKKANYILEKYAEVRFAERGLFFKKPKRKQIDPTTIEDVIGYYEEGHTQGFFLKDEDTKYVIILGSNELIDWWYNFAFRFMETPYKEAGVREAIKVHKGFYRSYLKAREVILHSIANDENIVVYGQSLGAAIATLAAIDIQYNFPEKNVSCMTTGSPRVGNQEFVNSYNRRVPQTTRFVYGNDIVTSVPPKLFGYEHVSEEYHLGPKKRLMLSIPDHMMSRYIPAIASELA